MRNAEQERIYGQFGPRTGELLTGVLRRTESNGNMILEVQKTEAVLPEREMLLNDRFRRGDRVKAVLTHVLRDAKGPQLIVSRSDTRFLAKLLELEIPEIFQSLDVDGDGSLSLDELLLVIDRYFDFQLDLEEVRQLNDFFFSQ